LRTARIVIALAVALSVQTSLGRFLVRGMAVLDVVLVAVVYIALTTGPVAGLLSGSAAGLAQDALSSGTLGIGGLAKAIVGCAVGAVGQQFIVTATLPRFFMFAAGSVVHAALFIGLYRVLGLLEFPSPWAAVAGQAAANAAVGLVVFMVVEGLPGVMERRRVSRRPKR